MKPFKCNVINVIFWAQKIMRQRNHAIYRKNYVCSEYGMPCGHPRMRNAEYICTYHGWKGSVPLISRATMNLHVTYSICHVHVMTLSDSEEMPVAHFIHLFTSHSSSSEPAVNSRAVG